jgi:hypothetical protein
VKKIDLWAGVRAEAKNGAAQHESRIEVKQGVAAGELELANAAYVIRSSCTVGV